ncbi:MAG: lipopolysaccharide ABC transporter ATP-binding protein, partial [Verrucomicrobia bacterium]
MENNDSSTAATNGALITTAGLVKEYRGRRVVNQVS